MNHEDNQNSNRGYVTFFAMIATAMVVMFGLMYLNTYELSHVFFSETRFYMTFLMGAAMAVIMLGFMQGMYHNRPMNLLIYVVSVLVFVGALFLVRSQITVADSSYIRAMIPHHSIAILTSERADIEDVRVHELADEIIEAQRREIREMEWLLQDIDQNGSATTQAVADTRPMPDFGGSE